MNKQQYKEHVQIARRIAEIEGVCDTIDRDGMPYQIVELLGVIAPFEYNPFDWSILGPLMLKYDVCLIPSVNSGFTNVSIGVNDSIWCGEKEEIPLAILECIIKSKEDQ